MKVKMKISSPDDSREVYTTSFLYRGTIKHNTPYLNNYGEYVVNVHARMNRKAVDPVIAEIRSSLENSFLKNPKQRKSRYSYSRNTDSVDTNNVTHILTWKFNKIPFSLVYQKVGSVFYINGIKLNKSDILDIIAKVVYRTCFVRDSGKLNTYLQALTSYPPNVMYCVENRTPYVFWKRDEKYSVGEKVQVSLNTVIISPNECALEISENIWASIKVKELNQFINYHKFDNKRAQKWALSPENLWNKLMGYSPTESQKQLMYAFLSQNRTQDIVEKRAQSLLYELEIEHPNKIFKVDFHDGGGKREGLIVRGFLSDWLLMDNHRRNTHQQVDTYALTGANLEVLKGNVPASKNTLVVNGTRGFPIEEQYRSTVTFNGAVCIDTLHGGTSLGDQLASRALALMNDKNTRKMLKTLEPYLRGESRYRLTDSDINYMKKEGAWFRR